MYSFYAEIVKFGLILNTFEIILEGMGANPPHKAATNKE